MGDMYDEGMKGRECDSMRVGKARQGKARQGKARQGKEK